MTRINATQTACNKPSQEETKNYLTNTATANNKKKLVKPNFWLIDKHSLLNRKKLQSVKKT